MIDTDFLRSQNEKQIPQTHNYIFLEISTEQKMDSHFNLTSIKNSSFLLRNIPRVEISNFYFKLNCLEKSMKNKCFYVELLMLHSSSASKNSLIPAVIHIFFPSFILTVELLC